MVNEIGRYLCLKYYKGYLRGELRQCVEKVFCGLRPALENAWILLLSGDLRRLTTWDRAKYLGGGAIFPDLISVDGSLGVGVVELKLYDLVGKNFEELLSSP